MKVSEASKKTCPCKDEYCLNESCMAWESLIKAKYEEKDKLMHGVNIPVRTLVEDGEGYCSLFKKVQNG